MTTVGKSLVASLFLHSAIVLAAVSLANRQPGLPPEWEHPDDPGSPPLVGELPNAIPTFASAEEQAPAMPPEPANDPEPPLLPTPSLSLAETPTPTPPITVAKAVPSSLSVNTPPVIIARQKSRNPSSQTAATQHAGATETGGGNALSNPARYARCPAPIFPDHARKAGLAGTVLLLVEIDENGRPLTVTVRRSSGHEVLDQAALRAVWNWRFEPARFRGKTTGARLEIPIRFARS